MKRIHLVYCDAGGGHKATALALRDALDNQSFRCDVSMVSIYREVLSGRDLMNRLFGFSSEEIYNRLVLRQGMHRMVKPLVSMLRGWMFLNAGATRRVLRSYWMRERPDLIVSVIPFLNKILYESIRASVPETPFVVCMTDMDEYNRNFWVQTVGPHYTCGTLRAEQQLVQYGVPSSHVHRLSGMIIHPQFLRQPDIDPAQLREELQLDPNVPVGIVMFGGYGSRKMETIVDALDTSGVDVQLLLVCGGNPILMDVIARKKTRIRTRALGYTRALHRYLAISDFMLGKPGPGSVSEAVGMGVPVIVEDNTWTMPQERYVARWIEEHGVGCTVSDVRDMPAAVETMLREYHVFRSQTSQVRNRAVYEACSLFEQLL